ncbi:MAG: radical SAM protein, partial [Acidobacteriota bacterium]
MGLKALECTLTTACNLACTYCHQGDRHPRVMSWAVLKAGIDRLLASEVEERKLALTGGEPLMEWPLVRRAIEYAQEPPPDGQGLEVSLTSNGLVLDEQKARFLVDHDVEVQISLDGIREAHELRAPGTFDVLDRLLVRLRRDHPSWYRRRLSVGMTLTSANLPFLSQSVQYLVERGIESLRLGPLLTHDAGWGREAEAQLERQMGAVFDCCLEHHQRTGAIPLEVLRRPATSAEPKP